VCVCVRVCACAGERASVRVHLCVYGCKDIFKCKYVSMGGYVCLNISTYVCVCMLKTECVCSCMCVCGVLRLFWILQSGII
jgi:hypothetical protein